MIHVVYPELVGHRFEIIHLDKVGDCWLAQFAVDNKLYPPFYEPHHNVVDLDEEGFLNHMRSQALTMQEYMERKAAEA